MLICSENSRWKLLTGLYGFALKGMNNDFFLLKPYFHLHANEPEVCVLWFMHIRCIKRIIYEGINQIADSLYPGLLLATDTRFELPERPISMVDEGPEIIPGCTMGWLLLPFSPMQRLQLFG